MVSPEGSPDGEMSKKPNMSRGRSFLTRQKTQSQVSAEFKNEVNGMRKFLNDHKMRNNKAARTLVNPDSRFMAFWDAMTTFALAYTALITPVEVAFIGGMRRTVIYDTGAFIIDSWFIVNRLIDLIFIFDILLQFFLMHEVPSKQELGMAEDMATKLTRMPSIISGNPDGNSNVAKPQMPYDGPIFSSKTGMLYVASHRKIVLRYVLSVWFPLDILSILPSAMDFVNFEVSSSGEDSTEAGATAINPFLILRILRATRLIKLIRLVKYQRIYRRMVSRISISHSLAVKIKVTVAVLVVSHWFACVFAMVATLHQDPYQTYWGQHGAPPFCNENAAGNTSGNSATGDAATGILEICGMSVAEWYVACLTWAMLVVTGTGGTDEFPTSTSMAENIVVTMLNLVAALFWTTVLATFCEVITHANPELSEFQQMMDELNIFMHNHQLPDLMRRKLREYFQQRKHVRIAQRAFSVTQQMSVALQAEITLFCYGSWLSKIYFLDGCEPNCLVQIALAMKPVVFAPAETPPASHFYVVKSGLVAFGPRLITSGKMWGEEIITYALKERYSARCMTYVDAYALSRTDLHDILENFEVSKWLVRRQARWLLLRRELVSQAKEHLKTQNQTPGVDSALHEPTDFLTRIMLTTTSKDEDVLPSRFAGVVQPAGAGAPVYASPEEDGEAGAESGNGTKLKKMAVVRPGREVLARVEGVEKEVHALRDDMKRVLALLEGGNGKSKGSKHHRHHRNGSPERARGISRGQSAPALPRGDADGEAIPSATEAFAWLNQNEVVGRL